MKYTKPPWSLELRKKGLPAAVGARHIIKVGDTLIASIPSHRGYFPGSPLCLEECEANARLLHAAPALLEALKALEEILSVSISADDAPVVVNRVLKARAAIAEAEGTEK